MADTTIEFLTVTSIAKRLNVARHRVEYALESRGQRPIGRVGTNNVYSESTLDVVRNALEAGARTPQMIGRAARSRMETADGRGAAETR